MPPLKNQRHELFAQSVVKGLSADAAFKAAGYRASRTNAARLRAKEPISARIAELLEHSGMRVEVTKARVIQELARIAFADMAELAIWTENGVTWIPSADLTEEQTRIVAEISETVTDSGGSIKLKMHDKLKAMDMIAKLMGWPIDKLELTGKDGGPVKTEGQGLSDASAELLKRKILGIK